MSEFLILPNHITFLNIQDRYNGIELRIDAHFSNRFERRVGDYVVGNGSTADIEGPDAKSLLFLLICLPLAPTGSSRTILAVLAG
jgi:hypothetical protein